MSEESGQEKTEQPTGRRLEQAIEQGQVLTSRDLVMAVVMLIGTLQFWFFGRRIFNDLINDFRFGLEFYNPLARDVPLIHVLADRFSSPLLFILLFSIPIALGVVATQISLGGMNFVWTNILPKGSRMSPASGLSRMFGPKSLIELAKSVLKMLTVGIVGYLMLQLYLPDILALSSTPFETAVEQSGSIFLMFFLVLVGAMALLGIGDGFLQWYQHNQRLLMTRQEVKDEHKQSEGNPEIKSRIRKLQQEVAQRKSVTKIAGAQVVIVNPEHFAVALQYDFEEGSAPKVVSKGADKVAHMIREKATELNIPVLEIPLLARAIYYTSEIGGEIHGELYRAVATVLSFVLNAGAQGDIPDIEVPDELQFDTNGRKLEGAK